VKKSGGGPCSSARLAMETEGARTAGCQDLELLTSTSASHRGLENIRSRLRAQGLIRD
jgi:hypothetical protein